MNTTVIVPMVDAEIIRADSKKQKRNMEIKSKFLFLLPAAGLEPARAYTQQILSLHRLPFRHAGFFQPKISLTQEEGNFKYHLKKFMRVRFLDKEKQFF